MPVRLRWFIPLLLLASAFSATHPAATCNTTDVQAAINLSVDGDTVTIPAGSCNWTSGVTVSSKGISILGAGTPNSTPSTFGASSSCSTGTVLTINSGVAFRLTPSQGNSTSRVSCLKLVAGGSAIALQALGSCTSGGCPSIRVDNITFTNWQNVTHPGNSYGITSTGDVFGVYDHNTITGTAASYLHLVEFSHASYLGTGLYGDYAWNQPENYGTANFLFIENNIFTSAGTSENEGSAGGLTRQGGGRIVARFNQYTVSDSINFALGWHGTETGGRPRSTRAFEFYDNTYTCTNGSTCGDVVASRGGTGHIWGNSVIKNSASLNNFYTMQTYRAFGNPGTWGACDGSIAYDTNDGVVYYSGTITGYSGGVVNFGGSPGWTTNQWSPTGAPYSMHDITQSTGGEIRSNTSNTLTVNSGGGGPGTWTPHVGDAIQILRATNCMDQAGGRGAGILYSGDPASPSASSAEVPSAGYIFLNQFTGGGPVFSLAGSSTLRVIPGRDYYVETLNQNAQTSPTSPFDGTNTIGVGHGILAFRPSNCTTGVGYWATDQGNWNQSGSGGQGQLYTCIATNTWSLYYTPYTYPHPLISGGGGGGGGANYPYGSNCTNGCGQPATGNIIIPTSINCELHDSAGTSHIQCEQATKDYGQDALPLTIDGTQLDVYWQNTVPASCGIVLGALANNSDRDQWQYDSPGVFHVGTSCHVNIRGLVPASANGNGAQGPVTFYLVSNPDATSGDPKGRYAPHVNTFPGPQCYNGSTDCYFNVAPPNPTAQLPLQWNGTTAGVVRAIRGHQAEIPLNILWVGGNATTLAALGTCDSTRNNYLGHVYAWSGAGGWASPNSGTWYVCKNTGSGFAWISNGSSLPAFVATSITATDGSGNTYTCPGSVNGGEDPTVVVSGVHTYPPKDICTGTAGSLGASVTPFYSGAWTGSGGASTDYRPIHYSSTLGYWMDTNSASAPFNAQPTGLLQYYPSATAVTGNITVTACFDTYTDTTLTTKANGTANFCITYTINVTDETPQAQVDPVSYPADSNEPAYHNNLVTNAISMCSSTSGSYYSVDYFNSTIDYWMWLTMSPGDWGQFNTGNYDNSRVFSQTQDFLLAKMDGTAWPAWASATSYGTDYDSMEVTDTNGHIWVATVNGGVSGGSITWPTSPVPGQTKTDNTQTWRYVGDGAFWRRCAHNAAIPYMNQTVQQNPQPWGQFPGGIFKLKERTGNAVLKGTTTYQGVLSAAVKNQINAGFGAGAFSQFSANAGRPPAYELMSLAAYAKTVCEEGNCAAFFSNAEMLALARWDQNAIINYSDIHIGSDPISTDYTRTFWPTFDPLHIGVGQMALREWKIRMEELGHPELVDSRIIPEVKRILDFGWTHWYNQCRVQGGSVDNFSFSYNPMDFQTCANGGQPGILEPHYTELSGTWQNSYDWVWRFCGGDTVNCKLSDGTAYNVAGNTIRRHQYDGRNCSNPQGKWWCTTYGIPYAGATGAPKPFGQVNRETTGNSYQYNYGFWTPSEDDQSPQHNPCWTGGSVPCSTPQPYPDTEAPYGVQLLSTGQDDPNCENHSTGQTCSPVQNVTSTGATFQMNFYEQLASLRWDYGTDQTCTGGSVTFSGTPTLKNGTNQLYEYLTPVSGLLPGTQYFARYCATDFAGNIGCNTCTAIPGGFRGGKINFTTLNQTVLTVLTTSLPGGQQGVAYTTTLQAAGGVPPYTWSITTGALPTGLSLNASTGVISGTPTSAGTFSFTVRVTDNASNHADQPLSITITNLAIVNTSLPAGTFNVAYSATLTGSGGQTPYTWALLLGNMPPGLSLNTSTGAITGTPTACGTFPDVWKLTDANSVFVTKPLSITVSGCTSTLTITTASLPNGIQGTAYTTTLHGTGGTGSGYTWSVLTGTLPDGLSLAASTGIISGTPTTAGTSNFTIQLRDSGGNLASAPLSITITAALSITTTSLPDGTFNVSYSATLTAAGGVSPYTWSIVNGTLPTGLSLNTSTGAITGTPTVCGTFGILWQVTDSASTSVQKSIPITVNGCTSNPVQVTTTSLPNGVVNQVYPNQTLTATGGTPPYTWSITVGSLPTGLSLNGSTGVISGTSTATGTFNFTVQATDTLSSSGTAPLGIVIISPGQLGVTATGSVSITGSATLGTPATTPPAGSPVGP